MNTVKKAVGVQQEQQTRTLSFNSLLSGEMRNRAEAKAMLVMIDRELSGIVNLEELDFRAGYLSGRIEEKESAGSIAAKDAESLKRVLYSKHEILRRLRT